MIRVPPAHGTRASIGSFPLSRSSGVRNPSRHWKSCLSSSLTPRPSLGVTVTAVKESQTSPTGLKVTDEERAALNLFSYAFLGEWIYLSHQASSEILILVHQPKARPYVGPRVSPCVKVLPPASRLKRLFQPVEASRRFWPFQFSFAPARMDWYPPFSPQAREKRND